MGAATLLIITWTPLSVGGNGAVEATIVLGARFVPTSVISSPRAMPEVNGAELAAFNTPVGLRYTPGPLNAGACKATLIPKYGPMPRPMRTAPPFPNTYCVLESLAVPLEFTV